jgi:hypothetical protein
MQYFFLLFITLLSFKSFGLEIEGVAISAKNKEFLYNEFHHIELDKDGNYQTLKTEYFDSSKNKIAYIESDFHLNRSIPNSHFWDYRQNVEEIIELDIDKKNINIEIKKNKKQSIQKIKILDSMIMGQGFHHFIVDHFDEVLKSIVPIKIVLAQKNDYFNFNVSSKMIDTNTVLIEVIPNNFILKKIVDPIKLTYEKSTKRLMVFEGLSNLESPSGDNQYVIINYKYK